LNFNTHSTYATGGSLDHSPEKKCAFRSWRDRRSAIVPR